MKAITADSKLYLILAALLLLAVLFSLSLLVSPPALALDSSVTTATADQRYPVIYGDKVVWQEIGRAHV